MGTQIDSPRPSKNCPTLPVRKKRSGLVGLVFIDETFWQSVELNSGCRRRRPPIAAGAWSAPSSSGSRRDRPLERGINRFEARVSEAGDTWIERLPW